MNEKSRREKQTPLMRQYWEIKSAHMDKILFFRMGDFFEIFHEDAEIAAPILGIALTVRNRKAKDETKMCGMPHHSIAPALNKLLGQGYKVAICDQIEDPRQAKGLVRRSVTRILSPGMVYDPETLDHLRPNYLASEDDHAVAFLETTTGEAFYFVTDEGRVRERLIRVLNPTEIVVPTARQAQWLQKKQDVRGAHVTGYDGVWDADSSLPECAHRLKSYALSMQGEELSNTLSPFERRPLLNRMELAPSVLRHLEVFSTYKGEGKGSLFCAINRAQTSGGARLIKNWLNFPLAEKSLIEQRLNEVQRWYDDFPRLKKVRQILSGIGDLQRRVGKISHPNCTPRDMISLANSLESGLQLSSYLQDLSPSIGKALNTGQDCIACIRDLLVEEPPSNIKNGQFVRVGYHAELDEWIRLSGDSQKLLMALETEEREKTGIGSLKIRYNNVFGYYIEITNTHKDKVPSHYRRKQTLANAERYVTDPLAELEQKVFAAKTRRVELELELFHNLRQSLLSWSHELLVLANLWSEVDVYSSLAWLAHEQRYVRPQFREDRGLILRGSRHPVVEQEVAKAFVSNELTLDRESCLLLTGPNMAGKSTLMRQVALIALLAQIGSFVPAESADLPIFDRIFTRIGASDFLSEGLSTFMVEMIETAEMLNQATGQSLVVLDEVGRGTSTYDGMSLAQAILEYLIVDTHATILFATHYHELTSLKKDFSQIKNAHMAIQERDGEISFLHTLREGPANKSYGIHVGRLAGLPQKVTRRAANILGELEKERYRSSAQMSLLPMDSSKDCASMEAVLALRTEDLEKLRREAFINAEGVHLRDEIKNVSLPDLTPLEALNRIAQWQKNLS